MSGRRRRAFGAGPLPPAAGLVFLVVLIAAAVPASAQTGAAARPPALPRPPIDLTVGGTWIGATSFGTASADLIEPDGGTTALFRTDSRLAPGAGLELGLGFGLTRRLSAEATGSWIRADFETRITDDFEDAELLTATTSLTRVGVEGAALWQVATIGRGVLLARGGVGWMRELADEGALIEDGWMGSAGVVYRRWWRERRVGTRTRRIGLRLDGRLHVRSAALTLGERKTRLAPAVFGGIVFGF